MSKLSDATEKLLEEIFPYYLIVKEYYIKYKATHLFFDFYIKEVGVLIECQGRQHDEFVKHFHGDKSGFMESKRRDNLKKEYCEKVGLVLLEIRNEKELDKDKVIERIWSKMIS